MKYIFVLTLLLHTFMLSFAQSPYISLSQQLIEAARYDKDATSLLGQLATIEEDDLATNLEDDATKKAFWINVYNAHIQILLKANPKLYEDRNSFFKTKHIVVAGKNLSFDDIEHGIIRRSKNKYSLGFLPSLNVDKFEKKFRVQKVDGRIHFALNCGAKSCPAVASYTPNRMDEQLDKSTKIHLQKTTKYNAEEDVANVTRLFSWFRADFGNKRKVVKFLKKYDTIPQDSKPNIKYNFYDWTLDLSNYIDL